MTGLMDTYGEAGQFSGWFNNVKGVLHVASDNDLMKPGSWESWVDESILGGITEGLAADRGIGTAKTSGGKAWMSFFNDRHTVGATDRQSKTLWAVAEQTATDAGISLAENTMRTVADPRGQTPAFVQLE
jgi:hypothetical protein